MSLKKNIRAEIVSNSLVCADTFRMVLSVDNDEFGANPGQFLMMRVSEHGISEPLLKRPFGVLKWRGPVEILYRVVGRGTEWMSQKKPGSVVEVMGPLGNGFDMSSILTTGKVVLAAGGIGIVPLFALVEYMLGIVEPPEITLLYGARTGAGLPLLDELSDLDISLKVVTEDGSLGEVGRVGDFLVEELAGRRAERIVIACGPYEMLKVVSFAAFGRDATCYVSLDSRMACGYGVCYGCAVKVRSETPDGFVYKRVCYDGPVFDSRELLWK